MSSELYFFDQYSHVSHLGGFYRSKRSLKDFDQAFHHVKVALSLNSDQPVGGDTNISLPSIKQTNEIPSGESTSISPTNKIIPEILTKELDGILRRFDLQPRPISPGSPTEQFEKSKSNLPKVSLPARLIIQLHSTWNDLIKNTNYNHKVWRTKAGEDAWRQYVRRQRSQQLNPSRYSNIPDDKPIARRRTSSRVSVSSISTASQRHSISSNQKARLSQSFSRASFMSTNSNFQEHFRLLKSIRHRTSEPMVESIKNGIHLEYKYSSQDTQTKQKMALFELPKQNVKFDENTLLLMQEKCKRLLAETKQKIRETNFDPYKKETNVGRIWFYGDNQFIRNKNDFLSSYESNRRQKSKFALAILRHEIPDKFHIDINIPDTKHKCYIELTDGSTQIFYPSGRLAVLRLQSPNSTTLFFDDTDSVAHQFLGLVTSTGSVLLMQPTFHARFVTNNQSDIGYLCHGKTGVIEKQFQWHSFDHSQRTSLSVTEDDSLNTIQIQINSHMQLEYHNSSNISFAFTCQDEEFKLQLGAPLPTQSRTLMSLTPTILAGKKMIGDKHSQSSTTRSNSISSSEEKQQKSKTRSHLLPMIQELNLLKNRIKRICHNWLKECRTTLGILHLDAYHLPDLPSQPVIIQTKPPIDEKTSNDKLKEYRRQPSTKNKFIQAFHRPPFPRTDQFESNIIVHAIEQYVPRSEAGRAIKQRIYTRQIIPATLTVMK